MKTNRYILMIVLLLFFSSCSSTQSYKTGEYGDYWGEDPLVSFQYTDKGIESYKIQFQFGLDENCTIGPLTQIIPVDEDGDFSIEGNAGDIAISGNINGTKASGTYSTKHCGTGPIIWAQEEAWTADFKGP